MRKINSSGRKRNNFYKRIYSLFWLSQHGFLLFFFDKTEIQPENQTAQPVQTPAEEPETAVAVAEPSHHVIVSCMATLKDAEEYQEWLKSLNYQHTRILPPVKTYRIAIESFTTKEEAIVYMQELRESKPQFADAWVLSDSGK